MTNFSLLKCVYLIDTLNLSSFELLITCILYFSHKLTNNLKS